MHISETEPSKRRRQRAKHSDYGKPVILSLLSAGHSTTKIKKERKKDAKRKKKKSEPIYKSPEERSNSRNTFESHNNSALNEKSKRDGDRVRWMEGKGKK